MNKLDDPGATDCRKRWTYRSVSAAILATALAAGDAGAVCPPSGIPMTSLQSMKAAQWKIPDGMSADALAAGLLDCLADPDPVLRDELAFDALSHWMRAKQVTVPALQLMRVRLLAWLQPGAADAAGFSQPFAALTLAEVARVDRLQPFLTGAERVNLVYAASHYLSNVRDYRGFDETEGWRHGVAHGADLMLQLSLNPALGRAELEQILTAIAIQVIPAGGHFYIYGEGERLMAPVYYVGSRGFMSAADWDAWFAALSKRVTAVEPVTQVALAQRHNMLAFLAPLYVALQESANAELGQRMLPAVAKALKSLD
jgi:hypothetical protein